ncbi:MAG: hypothetical protein HYV09_38500 [Deltaproteobacteria bacterium]|nr:hypothetical protein [Deltaproteobacteria bacterium]
MVLGERGGDDDALGSQLAFDSGAATDTNGAAPSGSPPSDAVATDAVVTDAVPATDVGPPLVPCTVPVPGPSKCPSGGCAVTVMATGLGLMAGALVDDGDGLLFGTNVGPPTFEGTIRRIDKKTLAVTTLATDTLPGYVVATPTALFWSSRRPESVSTGVLKGRDRAGLAPIVTLVSERWIDGFAVMDDAVYFGERTVADASSPKLMRVSAAGGPAEVVGPLVTRPVAAGADIIAWRYGPGGASGELVRFSPATKLVTRLASIPRSPSTPIVWSGGVAAWRFFGGIERACTNAPGSVVTIHDELDSTDPAFDPIVARDGWLYWATAKTISRVPLFGGGRVFVAEGAGDRVSSVAVDDDWLYFASAGTISRTPR